MEKLSIDSKCQETRNNQKQNNSFKSYQYVSLMYYTTNIWKFWYWNASTKISIWVGGGGPNKDWKINKQRGGRLLFTTQEYSF